MPSNHHVLEALSQGADRGHGAGGAHRARRYHPNNSSSSDEDVVLKGPSFGAGTQGGMARSPNPCGAAAAAAAGTPAAKPVVVTSLELELREGGGVEGHLYNAGTPTEPLSIVAHPVVAGTWDAATGAVSLLLHVSLADQGTIAAATAGSQGQGAGGAGAKAGTGGAAAQAQPQQQQQRHGKGHGGAGHPRADRAHAHDEEHAQAEQKPQGPYLALRFTGRMDPGACTLAGTWASEGVHGGSNAAAAGKQGGLPGWTGGSPGSSYVFSLMYCPKKRVGVSKK